MNTNHYVMLRIPELIGREIALPDLNELSIDVEPLEKLHVTLAFLGKHVADVRAVQEACVKVASDWAAPEFRLELALSRFYFPKRAVLKHRCQSDRLEAMRAQLVDLLTRSGHPPDAQYEDEGGWQPHVTVGRCPREAAVVSPATGRDVLVRVPEITYKAGQDVRSFRFWGPR